MKKEEKTEITKNKIFDAAIKEFGINGYAAGSVNNICKTGINKGLIYHNFKDKDELYLECVKKSCHGLICYIGDNKAQDSFVEYMEASRRFFEEHESEAYIFLEARTNPPHHLKTQIQNIYESFDELNIEICEKELSKHELRKNVSREDAISYFSEIQKIYNIDFLNRLNNKMTQQERLALHEMNIHKIFDLMLYGIVEGGNER